MKKFGVIKSKMLKTITDAYTKQKKSDVKNILNTIKENKDFKEMYLLYEDIENKYFEDKEVAKLYVEELSSVLKTKSENISEFNKKINQMLGSVEITEDVLYKTLDVLCENDSLLNIDKKVIAKKYIVDHLTTKKSETISENSTYTQNENLLHAVLANNFNVLYNNTLNEEQKNELKNILSLSNEDTQTKINELKENIQTKIGELISESKDDSLVQKLNDVLSEMKEMTNSKYNYYRLTQLKNGL